MNPFLNTAIKTAREAGEIIMRAYDRLEHLTVNTKGHNDVVTEADYASEQHIIEALQTAYPSHAILAEENGEIPAKESNEDDNLWIIDPLDGTCNFSHGYPHFCVSIALQHRGKIHVGVIYDPVRQDLYTATRGGGAQKNNHKIRVSKKTELSKSLVSTGFPYKKQEDYHKYFVCLESIARECNGVRRAGAAALDLAHVAAGHADGFWEDGLKPWDMAAGALLVREAGGLVNDFGGGEDYLASGKIIAATPKIMRPLFKLVQPLS
jgi:myo-inositol-1(or 4)-monophosphatase